MIHVERVANLQSSAASAVVACGSHLFIIADDEVHLEQYDIASGCCAARIPLIDRALSSNPEKRKAQKPDFESLTWLPDGSLLVLGSGSAERRNSGVLVRFGIGSLSYEIQEIDLFPLYHSLRKQFPDLNIEGAVVLGPVLRLLTRGGRGRDNAAIDLDLAATTREIVHRRPLSESLVRNVSVVDLGLLDGVPLGFTDGAPLIFDYAPDCMVFAAAAEDVDNPYDDGPCTGSVVGLLSLDGRVTTKEQVDGPHKIEGIVLTSDGMLMVADPDDPTRRAPLLKASLPQWARP